MAKRWKEEEDSLALKLRGEGYTTVEMALWLERSEGAIRTRLSSIATDKLNKAWSEEDKCLVLKLRNEGRSTKHIAFKLGRTVKAVSSYFYKLDKLPRKTNCLGV